MARESKQFTHSQLVAIVANLRGELESLTRGFRCVQEGRPDLAINEDDIENAEQLLEHTAFDLSPEDTVDGGFDSSWYKVKST